MLAAIWLFFQLGYGFETNDQVQYLLLPYRSIEQPFLPGDWFTWETSHYHLTFAWLVRALHAIGGDDGFRYAMLAAHLAGLAWLGYACLRLSRALGGGAFEAAIPLVVMGCTRDTALGGAILNHGCLLPSDLALAPFLLAAAANARARDRACGVWLGLSGLLHANFAVLGPLALGPLALLRALRTGQLRGFAQLVGAYVLIASPTLIPIAGAFLAQDRAPEAIAITLFVRSPHHYDLASMPAIEFYWMGVLALSALPAFIGRYRAPQPGERARLAIALVVWVAVGLFAAGVQWVAITRFFTLRLSVPLAILLWISWAQLARALSKAREPAGFLWLGASVAVLGAFVREDILTIVPWHDPPQRLVPGMAIEPGWQLGLLIAPLALATLALIALPATLPARVRNSALALLAAAPIALALWLTQVPIGRVWTGLRFRTARSAHLFERKIELAPPDRELYARTRAETPTDARFLIAPGLFEFRMRARRTVYVDWKCTPMKGDEALEWKRRMLLTIGASDFPARGYELPLRADRLYYARPAEQLIALARDTGMTHVILRRSQLRGALPGTRVSFTAGSFAVLELEE